MKLRLFIMVLGALLFMIGAWYVYVYIHVNNNKNRLEVILADLNQVESAIIINNSICNAITYSELELFSYKYPQIRDHLEEIKGNFSGGLYAFWLSSRRTGEKAKISQIIEKNDALLVDVLAVQESLKGVNSEYHSLMSDCRGALDIAISNININSDADVFEGDLEVLDAKYMACLLMKAELESEINMCEDVSGRASMIQDAVLQYFVWETVAMADKLKTRIEAIAQAGELLFAYKQELKDLLGPGFDLNRNISNIATNYQTVINIINIKLEPVQNMTDQLYEPISMGTGVFGDVLSVSAVEMIKIIDPASGEMIDAIKFTMDMMDQVQAEMENIVASTDPFLGASAAFFRNSGRANMQELIASSIELRDYYESKRNVFLELNGRLDKINDYTRQIDASISALPSQKAREMVYSFTRDVRGIVGVAYTPFIAWTGIVDNTSESVNFIVDMESVYISKLETLANPNLIASDIPE